jgi:hypothetical protein
MKLSLWYLEHLDSQQLRHANRLKSWVCAYKRFESAQLKRYMATAVGALTP